MNFQEELERNKKRRNYESLDDMAKEEGIISVLEFLSYNPTIILNSEQGDGVYRHTKMKIVPFKVTKTNF